MSKVFDAIRREEYEAGRMEGLLKGREAGRIEGHEAGRKEGHEAGQKEGLSKRSVQIALRMLAAGKISPEEIADITELSLDEVYELRKKQSA